MKMSSFGFFGAYPFPLYYSDDIAMRQTEKKKGVISMTRCQYAGKLPVNRFCIRCSLWYETCSPVCGHDGTALSHECGMLYFCEGCLAECSNKEYINL